ncbi:MAG: hypothetical protein A3F90_13115 [Deltaproteobacteria bacterium RIFCSPLOWO2_12_FULL_60_19]|nr:MAG: hypothetical protein A3F90_13115 [Deltaproteobacteria bacterium RIFCSPLOWO2_12_FULL_60_19]
MTEIALLFPATFLLFVQQVAVGGLFALAATPFHEFDRAFYKSTGGVLFVIGALGLLGKIELYRKRFAAGLDGGDVAEALLYVVFIAAFALYLYSLWGERIAFRARTFAAALLTGIAGLVFSAQSFHPAPAWSIEAFVYPVSFLLSALLLGGVTVGMLLGHWYLIDTGQTIEPFVRIFKFFVFSLAAQTLFFLCFPPILYYLGSPGSAANLTELWNSHSLLLTMRLLITQVGSLVLSGMIWRTLKIPHTMAATGLLYIALLGVFVGEILGRRILALTSLPF